MQTQIETEQMEEPVKRFLSGLEISTEPAVAEFDGRKVYIMVRLSGIPRETEGPWSTEKDRRRCDLIDKQIDGVTTIGETVELSELQAAFDRWIDGVSPLPIEPALRLHDRLLARVLAGSSASAKTE